MQSSGAVETLCCCGRGEQRFCCLSKDFLTELCLLARSPCSLTATSPTWWKVNGCKRSTIVGSVHDSGQLGKVQR